MLGTLLAQLALALIKMFVSKAEERAAWEQAIKERLRELDGSADESAKLHAEYDELQKKLQGKLNGNPPSSTSP
jgi:DNA repair ATPase RecN